MRIIFNKVLIYNFLSIGEVELSLSSNGFVLVSGINNNPEDLAKANGSGKSAIFESIIWALTGETIRETRDIVNRYNAGGTCVELHFKVDDIDYKVVRYREHKTFGNNLKIFVNGEDKSGKGIRDSENILKQYLPDLTSSLLGSVIILGQGLPQRFTKNTPSGRKEILEILSKSDFMIQDIKNKLSDRQTYLNNEFRKHEDDLLSSSTKLEIYKSNLNNLKLELSNFVDINTLVDSVNSIKSELNTLNLEINSCKASIETSEETLNNLRIAQEKETYNKIDALNNFDNLFKAEQDKLNNKYLTIEAEFKNLNSELIKFKNIKDTCPTCNQKLPHVHKIDTTDMEIECQRLKSDLNKSKESLNEFIKNKRIERAALEESFNINLNNLKNNISDFTDKLKQSKNVLLDLNSKYETLNKKLSESNYKLESYKELKSKLEFDIKTLESSIKELDNKILYIINNKENIANKIKIVNKMFSIASRDFRGFLLLEVIRYIDNRAKEYSKLIFNNELVEFKLDGNNIYIAYNGKEYEGLSGGEKQKIDLIVQFSIRDMLSKFLNFSSNILVLDEIFDNLDSLGCDKVVNMIITTMTDIDSVYIITHHSDIDIPVDKEIVIEKDANGVSRII